MFSPKEKYFPLQHIPYLVIFCLIFLFFLNVFLIGGRVRSYSISVQILNLCPWISLSGNLYFVNYAGVPISFESSCSYLLGSEMNTKSESTPNINIVSILKCFGTNMFFLKCIPLYYFKSITSCRYGSSQKKIWCIIRAIIISFIDWQTSVQPLCLAFSWYYCSNQWK